MFGIFGKKKKEEPEAIEPTREEALMLPMNLATYGWDLTKIKMKLFQCHVESGRKLAVQAQAYIDGDPEKLRKIMEDIYSDKTIKKSKRELDDVREEIEESIGKNLRLFQNANFLLMKAGETPLDLSELKISDSDVDNILAGATPDNIYDKLNEYREYLDKFLDRTCEICNTLPFKVNNAALKS